MDREGRIVSEQGWQLSAAQQILDSPKEGWVGATGWVDRVISQLSEGCGGRAGSFQGFSRQC